MHFPQNIQPFNTQMKAYNPDWMYYAHQPNTFC